MIEKTLLTHVKIEPADVESLAWLARSFAMKVHANQVRKYTDLPYTTHLAEVAGIVSSVLDHNALSPDTLIAVAWLHDAKEDQGVTDQQLWHVLHDQVDGRFGIGTVERVVRGVSWLTSENSTKPRRERKHEGALRLGQAPHWVQTIKCADIFSNASSVAQLAPDFARIYLKEKEFELLCMEKAHSELRAETLAMVRQQQALVI